MAQVADFLPSENGLLYPNSWASEPDLVVVTPFGTIGVGDASDGLCGGMVFAVRDLFHARRRPPATSVNPPGGSPAFRFLVRRLFASFDIPRGVARYYLWMNLPFRSRRLPGPARSVTVKGLWERTVDSSMPALRRSIDRGEPCPLGLVCVHSARPTELGRNHQVLAYRYEERCAETTVWVYDPNHPGRDDVRITFPRQPTGSEASFRYSTGDQSLLGFFPVRYSWADPTPLFADPGTT